MAANPRLHRGANDRRLYSWAALGIVLIILVGFGRTYYFKQFFDTPALPGLVHFHGLVMSVWVALFVVQTRLVAARRTDLHRRLGVFAGVWACVVVAVGVVTAINGARRGMPSDAPPLEFLTVPLGDMVTFAVLTGVGLYFRRRSDIHKRLMLLASVGFLTAGVARIPLSFIETGGPLVYFGLTDLCLLTCIAYDTVKQRTLHPAFALGATFLIASQPLRLLLSGTDIWLRFATWLVG